MVWYGVGIRRMSEWKLQGIQSCATQIPPPEPRGSFPKAPESLDVSSLQLNLSAGPTFGWRELLAYSPGEAYTQWLINLGVERPSPFALI